jgi:KamA family protein
MPGSKEAEPDLAKALAYIAQRPEVREVLLTGGDPLMLSTRRLGALLDALAEVDHIQVVRISSKMVAFNPWRILDDGALGGVLGRFVSSGKSLYFMAHFDHPRELTPPAMEALERLKAWGLVCLNQCPLVKGVNDDPSVLGELWLRLAEAGCPPYYLFQLRPTAGNAPYVVPILQGIEIVESAGRGLSGLAKRARYVMSHATGKIEILGATSSHILLRYHRAPEPGLEGKIIACRRDEKALWMDDLEVVPEAECQPADSLLRRRGSFMEPERKPSRSRVT